ncbi:aldose epimerase family protein [Aquimarina intermedia]|uniref:Aldose 1-epimerase n=1 Tax=Aquimarina intermedia TaxID=350814 RepID=A0A5S5C2F8_9FLAO|nr:aldose epimerase family protein [Aquimarina intermedia]TYP72153.1 aldose 1-epimerase [Aquimarina intermedia]
MKQNTIEDIKVIYKGKEIKTLVLENQKGSRLTVSNYGASILSFETPDKEGKLINVIVGLASSRAYIDKYINGESILLGATVGRYAGRISTDVLRINEQEFPIYHENGIHLHGGKHGLDGKFWKVKAIDNDTLRAVFEYKSEHLEEGYPGNVLITASYQLTEINELKIIYTATSDKDTVINLTNHAYFNLDGAGSIKNHELQLSSREMLEVDTKMIPTGIIKPVANTAYDFRKPSTLNKLHTIEGLDDTFIYEDTALPKAVLKSLHSGIKMEVFTNQPAVVIFTPKELPQWKYAYHAMYDDFPAICFENQKHPDAPNHPHFPSTLLKAGEVYENTSVFVFGIDD